MNEIKECTEGLFEDIKHIDKNGNEYWFARKLPSALEYKEWRKFEGVIEKAKISCINSNVDVNEHFVGVDKMIKLAKTQQEILLIIYFQDTHVILLPKMEIREKK